MALLIQVFITVIDACHTPIRVVQHLPMMNRDTPSRPIAVAPDLRRSWIVHGAIVATDFGNGLVEPALRLAEIHLSARRLSW